MKKILSLLTVSFVFLSAGLTQVTQERADKIVRGHIRQELLPCTIYAKEGIQTDMTITTITGKVIELDYCCWVYYVTYTDNAGRYLIVNESRESLLEVNAIEDAITDDLAEWRIVEEIDIPYCDIIGDWVNVQQDILSFTSNRYVQYKPFIFNPKDPTSLYEYEWVGDSIAMRLFWSGLDYETHYFKCSDDVIEIHHFQNVECDFYYRIKED